MGLFVVTAVVVVVWARKERETDNILILLAVRQSFNQQFFIQSARVKSLATTKSTTAATVTIATIVTVTSNDRKRENAKRHDCMTIRKRTHTLTLTNRIETNKRVRDYHLMCIDCQSHHRLTLFWTVALHEIACVRLVVHNYYNIYFLFANEADAHPKRSSTKLTFNRIFNGFCVSCCCSPIVYLFPWINRFIYSFHVIFRKCFLWMFFFIPS